MVQGMELGYPKEVLQGSADVPTLVTGDREASLAHVVASRESSSAARGCRAYGRRESTISRQTSLEGIDARWEGQDEPPLVEEP